MEETGHSFSMFSTVVLPLPLNRSDGICSLGLSEDSSCSVLTQLHLSNKLFREIYKDTVTVVGSTKDKCTDTVF